MNDTTTDPRQAAEPTVEVVDQTTGGVVNLPANVAKQLQSVPDPEPAMLSTQRIMMDSDVMDRMLAVAEQMAGSKITVPKHFQGAPGDCLAVVMQAAQWGMNPFAVAQKTHVVNGTLGYEAQLVNAVVQQSGAIRGRFYYEYNDESGDNLACRVGAILAGERNVTWDEWLRSGDVTVKNSPLWKTNPKQQLGYLQVKNWARKYCPGAILGVYTPDDVEEFEPRDMGTATRTDKAPPRQPQRASAARKQRQEAPGPANGDQPVEAQGTEGKPITEGALKHLQRLLDEAQNCDAEKLCKAYEISALTDLRMDQMNGAINWIRGEG